MLSDPASMYDTPPMSTEPAVSHGRAISRTPPKPTATPSALSGVMASLRRKTAALTNENRGIAPLSAPAMPEASSDVPDANAK